VVPYLQVLRTMFCAHFTSHACVLHAPLIPSCDLITLIIFGEAYKLWSSSFCSLLQPPATSSLLGPNVLLSTLFSNALNLCFSLCVKDRVSHPYKTSKIRVLYVLIWKVLAVQRLGYGMDDRGSIPSRGTASRPALGPTQPPIQWVPGALSPGVKWPGREAVHSPHLVSRLRMCGAIPPLPNTPSWRGGSLRTGTTFTEHNGSKRSLSFLMNAILIYYCCYQISKLFHIFKGFIGNQ
jgi:hypothetical protein